jgi:site-specific recombinase XerD
MTNSSLGPTATHDVTHAEEPVWQKSPLLSFDTWLANQAFADSSTEIYQLQWRQFINWLSDERIALSAVEPDTVERFLINLEIKQDQRQRYLRLIERVFNHLRRHTFGTINPATEVALHPEHDWASVAPNEPTGFLHQLEYAALADYLCQPLAPRLSAAGKWRALRDKTMVATFAGAGLKMAELQTLTLSGLSETHDWITLIGSGIDASHRAQMQPFTDELMKQWLQVRADAGTAGSLVFPATRAGRMMHKATVLRATAEQLRLAGISAARDERASPQTLRNSYAAALFQSGIEVDRVAAAMGFKQIISAQRMKGAWDTWTERATSREHAVQAG